MIAPLPAWTKVLWIAIRGFQGAGESCRASYTTIGERCLNDQGNEMDKAQISRGVKILIDAGFLERVGSRHLRCITPTRGEENVDAASTNGATNVDSESTLTEDQRCSTVNGSLITHQQNVDHPSTPSESQQENQQENQHTVARKKKSVRFQKPTVEQIRAYFAERNAADEAQAFYDYHESKGWKVGRASMKDWKAAVRTWIGNDFSGKQAAHGKKKDRYAHIPPPGTVVKYG